MQQLRIVSGFAQLAGFELKSNAHPAGYSMLTGGWEGGQADYARVVFGALSCAVRMSHA